MATVVNPTEQDANAGTDDVFEPFLTENSDSQPNVTGNGSSDEFDPFQIGESAAEKQTAKKSLDIKRHSSSASAASVPLPPRLLIKFKVHEEVSSTAYIENDKEGASEVFVLGTVLAQVTSSDALKNSPWILTARSISGAPVDFTPNESYAKSYATKTQKSKVNVIKVPKSTVGFVTVGKYSISETVDHMPLLLERNVTRKKSKVQIGIQVRSKLSNPDDLREFSVAVSISDEVIGSSLEISSGEGEIDRMKRTVTWKIPHLPKGESFLVSVRGHLLDEALDPDVEMNFPVMLRCRSQDQISSTRFQAIEASGYPATVSFSTVGHTCRMIHRLK